MKSLDERKTKNKNKVYSYHFLYFFFFLSFFFLYDFNSIIKKENSIELPQKIFLKNLLNEKLKVAKLFHLVSNYVDLREKKSEKRKKLQK